MDAPLFWRALLLGLPTSARLPRLVARGYPAAVSGRSRSVTPFYDELSGLKSPGCDQFVISIDLPDYMRTPALRDDSRFASRDVSETRYRPGIPGAGDPSANAITGQPRRAATALSARSGLTACG